MLFIYSINTENILDLNNELLDIVSDNRKERISNFYFMKDKVQSLFAEVLLRYALWINYKIKSEDIEFKCVKYGKPYLMNQKNIYFNISHSGEWVICAVGDFQSGIDIEKVKKSDLSFAKSIYSKEEYEYLLNIPEEEQAKMFCKIWTLKESYVKYIGQGLRTPFNSFFFKFKDENVKLYIDKKEENNLKFFTDKLDELHYLSLCVNKQDEKNVNFNITKLTLSKLLSWSRTINNL